MISFCLNVVLLLNGWVDNGEIRRQNYKIIVYANALGIIYIYRY